MIHWDGKIVEEFLALKQGRIGVIITGGEHERSGKLLGIHYVPSSSGLNQANSVFNLAKEWYCADEVVGMVFDATASNTGKHAGTAVILERRFKRKLMWIAYRHHNFELVLWFF